MALSSEAVESVLEKMMASPAFATADRMRRFLRFVVSKTLSGEAESLKEYLIGVEVFDRGDGFDPRTDTIVRVEARRLRKRKSVEFTTVRIENIAPGWRAKESYRILSPDEFVETFSLTAPGKDFEVYSETNLKTREMMIVLRRHSRPRPRAVVPTRVGVNRPLVKRIPEAIGTAQSLPDRAGMRPDQQRWRRIERIYHAALEHPPSKRGALWAETLPLRSTVRRQLPRSTSGRFLVRR